MARCRMCPAETVWAINKHTSRAMILDVAPTPDGNVLVEGVGAIIYAHVMTDLEREQVERLDPTRARYADHHATCPAAKRVDAGELVGQGTLF